MLKEDVDLVEFHLKDVSADFQIVQDFHKNQLGDLN